MTVIVLDNVAPVVAPLAADDRVRDADRRSSLAAQATDADGDALTFACCDGVRGGTVDVVDERRRTC